MGTPASVIDFPQRLDNGIPLEAAIDEYANGMIDSDTLLANYPAGQLANCGNPAIEYMVQRAYAKPAWVREV